jgi:nucleotide-binding universal stress UspA family protein
MQRFKALRLPHRPERTSNLKRGGKMPKKVERILFPMELVELTREIAPWVELMARELEAEVHVLHVIPDPGYWGVPYAMSPSHLDDEPTLIRRVEKKVVDFCEENLSREVRTTIQVKIGDPADEILGYTVNEAISMVILGTHARRGLESLFFGSVAERVIKSSPVPVMSVNPHAATG